MSISNFTKELKYNDGIWFSEKNTNVSYPDIGHDECFMIEDNSFWFNHRNNCIITAIKNYPPNGPIMDIGGGNGYVSLGLNKKDFNTILVEPGIKGILNAKNRGVQNLVCSSLEDMKLEKDIVPAFALFDVLEHIEDDVLFLKQLHELLTEDGLLYLTIPAYQFLWSNEDSGAGHHRRYSLNSIVNKLNKVGFEIKYSTYIFSIVPFPIFLSRTIPSKLSIKKRKNIKKDHVLKSSNKNSILNLVWHKEIQKIKENKKMSFGGSCLIVAKVKK